MHQGMVTMIYENLYVNNKWT